MKVYLVGGAVRDQLLGLPVTERDWVVVGATPEQLLALGYKPVGKNFPVFLHPQTHEEYALARTERKTAPGYSGFVFHADPSVTLEADLHRRDLTINAMAFSVDENQLIDPYGGQFDLANKVLRHVSEAFVEDPVRILRIARFSARFGEFSVHPSTMWLMQTIVQQGEVHALVAERVWQELVRALAEDYPDRFFKVLSECGALSILFPELQNNSLGFVALNQCVRLHLSSSARFAALCYPLNSNQIKNLCIRYRVSRDYHDIALMVSELYPLYQRLSLEVDSEVLNLLERSDAFRRPKRFEEFMKICAAVDHQDGLKKIDYLKNSWLILKSINFSHFKDAALSGDLIASAVHQARLEQLRSWRLSGNLTVGKL